MKKLMSLVLAWLFAAGMISVANAAIYATGLDTGIYATDVDATTTHHWDVSGGGGAQVLAHTEYALNEPDGRLTGWMMGGGYIEVSFDLELTNGFGDDLTVYSFGPGTSTVSIFDGTDWTSLGNIASQSPGNVLPTCWDFGGVDLVSAIRIDKVSETPGKFFDAFEGTHPVPIPCAVWLLGSGLVGLFGIRKKIRA